MKVAKLKMNIGQALLLVLVTTELFIYLFLIFYWSLLLYNVVLVSAVEHSDSAKHIHTPPLFWISFPFRSPQSTEQNSLCRTVDSCWLSLKYIVVYICQTLSPNPFSPLPFPPWCSQVGSLCLCLYSYPTNKFSYTIFLDSTYMH